MSWAWNKRIGLAEPLGSSLQVESSHHSTASARVCSTMEPDKLTNPVSLEAIFFRVGGTVLHPRARLIHGWIKLIYTDRPCMVYGSMDGT